MSFDWNAAWGDQPRPFFGEESEPVGAALAPLTRGTYQRAGTTEALWEMRIADGECPRGSCSGRLDDGACTLCGWSLTEFWMRERLKSIEDKPDYITRIPGALSLDEYAEANVDD